MKKTSFYCFIACLLLLMGLKCPAQDKYPQLSETTDRDFSNKLSNQVMPVIGVWVWGPAELLPDGFKKSLDEAGKHSPYNLLIPFLRFPDKEVVDDDIHQQVKLAADYAVEQNLALVADLDVRSARRAFKREFPEELQEMLRIKEILLTPQDSVDIVIPSLDLNDHYSGGIIPHHQALSGSFLRAYSYQTTADGIVQQSLRNITGECYPVFELKDSVKVRVPSKMLAGEGQTHICIMVSFRHFYPDVFSPHLMEFQSGIIRQYGDVKLAGVCKDEWGFPPYYPRFYRLGFNDFWYSKFMAQAYSNRTEGRELLADCLLMAKAFKGRESERQKIINHYMDMSLLRNSALEEDFYQVTKEVFGPDAAVTVHSTWWPFPDLSEFRKNGLDWWTSRRDWAQTDEVVPFAVRTALSKKWGSAIWYNMYYKTDLATQVWSSALAGGRINYLSFQSLYDKDIMLAENRIRLLNYISNSPLDCPVAVIFGHACAMNWAGPRHNDVGMQLVDSLWHIGYATDLIPTSEIANGSLYIDADGSIAYGKQRYSAIVLYHPEFEGPAMADFFIKAAKGNTAMYRIGEWTKDFNGEVVDGDRLLPSTMIVSRDIPDALAKLTEALKSRNISLNSPATGVIDNTFFGLRDFTGSSLAPPTTGFSRLIDGTFIQVAGTRNSAGDTIKSEFELRGQMVTMDAIGVAAVRLGEKGQLQALAAGALKYFKAGDILIALDERKDIALWRDEEGNWQGVIQGDSPEVPSGLLKITKNWTPLIAPVPPLAISPQ